jgi:hypothetical protein
MTKLTLARVISVVCHPFALATFLATSPLWTPGGTPDAAIRVTAVVLMVAVVPLTIFVRRRRATGEWQTVDASRPAERPALFRASFAALAPLAAYFYFVERSPLWTRGTLAAILLLAAAAALNHRVKLSLHVAFATFATISLVPLGPSYYLPLACLLPLLAWSRLALGRHTRRELVAGFILGAIMGPLCLA